MACLFECPPRKSNRGLCSTDSVSAWIKIYWKVLFVTAPIYRIARGWRNLWGQRELPNLLAREALLSQAFVRVGMTHIPLGLFSLTGIHRIAISPFIYLTAHRSMSMTQTEIGVGQLISVWWIITFMNFDLCFFYYKNANFLKKEGTK